MCVKILFFLSGRKFISCMMWDGKKALSQRIFKEVISILSLQLHNIM